LTGPLIRLTSAARTPSTTDAPIAVWLLEIILTRSNVESSRHDVTTVDGVARRRSAETKAAFKTTEFIAYVVITVAILIASVVVDGNGNGDNGSSGDYFRADRAWLYITLLTIGYMVSRGLAKAGTRAGDNS
jgi:hypothetical protein